MCNFLGETGSESTEKLTKRALDDGLSVSTLWNMLSAHVQAQFYAPITPDDDPDDAAGDILATVAKENADKAKPFIPVWLMCDRRSKGA